MRFRFWLSPSMTYDSLSCGGWHATKQRETSKSDDLFRARLDQIHSTPSMSCCAWQPRSIGPGSMERSRRFTANIVARCHALHDRPVAAQAHLRAIGRRCVRALGRGPILPVLYWRGVFQHTFPHERSGLSHWRKRLGDKLGLLLAESLRVAHTSGALRRAIWSASRSTLPSSPKISPSRPTPSLCMPRSRGSTA